MRWSRILRLFCEASLQVNICLCPFLAAASRGPRKLTPSWKCTMLPARLRLATRTHNTANLKLFEYSATRIAQRIRNKTLTGVSHGNMSIRSFEKAYTTTPPRRRPQPAKKTPKTLRELAKASGSRQHKLCGQYNCNADGCIPANTSSLHVGYVSTKQSRAVLDMCRYEIDRDQPSTCVLKSV